LNSWGLVASKLGNKMKIVLYYFDFPFWRAEVARLALHLGKLNGFDCDFEDHRIKDRKEWLKEGKAPYGQVPVMEVDGKIIAQTGAIARFCGKMSGMYPTGGGIDDHLVCAKIDEVIDTCTDITNLIAGTFRFTDEKEKLAARGQLCTDKFPMYFKAMEDILKENGSNGFYAGPKMSIADIAVWRLLGWFKKGVLDGIPTEIFDSYPLVLKHYNDIGADSAIKAWMESHYGAQ